MLTPPKPRGFIPAEGVQWARFADSPPPFIRAHRKVSGRRAQGIRYERKVHEWLGERFEGAYLPSPWITFACADGHVRWCQPDGLLFNLRAGVITLIEVKYQHTSDAWWQLRKLYQPVLGALFPSDLWSIQCLEVVKWYDPAVVWPEPLRLVDKPAPLPQTSASCVHIWKP